MITSWIGRQRRQSFRLIARHPIQPRRTGVRADAARKYADLLFLPDDRTPIYFACGREGDFTGLSGGEDFIIGEELPWGVPWREGNLNLFPYRVETITRNGVNHRNKRLAAGQAGVGLKDEIQGLVVLQQRSFRSRWKFHELDGQQIAVVVGRYFTGNAVSTGGVRARGEGECEDHRAEK